MIRKGAIYAIGSIAKLLTQKSPYRTDYLLALRGVLAFGVVAHHYGYRGFLNKTFGVEFFSYLAPNGAEAVYLFFVLSGYLMAKILHEKYNYKKGVLHFYFNRFTRIAPVYYFAVLISFPAAAVVERYWVQTTNIENLVSTLFFAGNYGSLIANAPLWSLSTEMQFYLLAPLLPLIFATTNRKYLISIYLLVLVTSVLVRVPYYEAPRASYYFYTGLEVNLLFFLTGWMAYRLRDSLPRFNPWLGFWGILLMLLASWVVYVELVPHDYHGMVKSLIWYFYTPLVFSIIYLLLLPSLDQTIETSSESHIIFRAFVSFLSFLGVTSFSVYVIHMVFPRFLLKVSPDISALGIPITIKVYLFCFLVYLLIEKPFYSFRIKPRKMPSVG